MQDRPLFMENKEWYGFDFKKRKFYCTDKAPEEAKRSLEEFEKTEERMHKSKPK